MPHRPLPPVAPAAVLAALAALACGSFGPEDVVRDESAPIQTAELCYRLADDGTGTYHLLIPSR